MLTSLARRLMPSATITDLIRNITSWLWTNGPVIAMGLGAGLFIVGMVRLFQYAWSGHRKGSEHIGNAVIAIVIGGILAIGGGFVKHLMTSTGQTINQWGGGMVMPVLVPVF